MRLCLVLCLVSCGDNVTGEDRLGGDATIDDRSAEAFTHPMPNLDAAGIEHHNLGRGPFRFTWTPPQLGPLFNHTSCVSCHAANGRGIPRIEPGFFGSEALVRVSVAAGTPEFPGGPVPSPEFGLQLQDHATVGLPEVFINLSWVEIEDFLGDGTVVMRRAPQLDIHRPDGSALPSDIMMSMREAPALVGIGLLEAIPDDDLMARADPDDLDGDGISGRPNLVWGIEANAPRLGRFGRKASVPTVAEQAANAFANDIGLTNKIIPEADGSRDINDNQFADSIFHVMTLGVPAQAQTDAIAERGRSLFHSIGCISCHVPDQRTGDHPIPELANQTIHPYTDLLLHDMGDDLADGRPDFLASGSEWRTPALWGIGLAQVVQPGVGYLHDGRARTLTEAILWHGGEAVSRRERFRNASPADRDALLTFLGTL